jgi:hypothetical protein
MSAFKIITIKVALLLAVGFFLTTEVGKPYAEKLKPLVETIISQ